MWKRRLAAVEGVSAVAVDLEAAQAVVTLAADVADEKLVTAVTEAGYEVVSVPVSPCVGGGGPRAPLARPKPPIFPERTDPNP